jgi:hypothetical protein
MADMDVAPMKIVGFEGFFGIIGTLFIMAPICYYLNGNEGEGIHEDIIDTMAVRMSLVRSFTLQTCGGWDGSTILVIPSIHRLLAFAPPAIDDT